MNVIEIQNLVCRKKGIFFQFKAIIYWAILKSILCLLKKLTNKTCWEIQVFETGAPYMCLCV